MSEQYNEQQQLAAFRYQMHFVRTAGIEQS